MQPGVSHNAYVRGTEHLAAHNDYNSAFNETYLHIYTERKTTQLVILTLVAIIKFSFVLLLAFFLFLLFYLLLIIYFLLFVYVSVLVLLQHLTFPTKNQ